MVGFFLLLVRQKPASYVSMVRVFSLPQGNQRSLPDSSPGHVDEPTKGWWATDTDVSGEAMGMQQTLCPW